MINYDQQRFIRAEQKLIELSKWVKGEEIKADPGNKFVQDWITKYAKDFRTYWEQSCCKDCIHDCAYQCKAFCDRYERDIRNKSNTELITELLRRIKHACWH